ncbi:hypothetical protein BDU57DRAFT_584981 [Ampelomyces quisqualis]|uniref:Uncharacterized protein n=1 Tax=Ampelomyces quisqualis TaxID=50730 RepID=A0A6A5R3R1_AMPQU|nr:hypothetical protein BDU57DRAFT_584981 [Ampelomyces quisqualis]
MPGLTYRKGGAVSLVQDQDIFLHVTDLHVSSSICRGSRYLPQIIDVSEDATEITLGGELKRSASNTHGQEEGENREGMLVMLTHLHGLAEQRMQELGLHKISVLGVWYAIAYCERDQYGSAKDELKAWFEKWYATSIERFELDIDSARGLAFPCQLFDHALAFARVTKWLAYNHVGYVKQRPPKGFKGHRGFHPPPGEFVGPVNHARSGLKTTLHKSLYKKCGHLLRYKTSDCECWAPTVGHCFAALTKIECFPVEDIISYTSVSQILSRLSTFKYDYIPACQNCRAMEWEVVVLKAKSNTEKYFDGLCLDCMDRMDGRWDTNCRIKHNQSTWYVSWLGKPNVREKIMRGPDGYDEEEY